MGITFKGEYYYVNIIDSQHNIKYFLIVLFYTIFEA